MNLRARRLLLSLPACLLQVLAAVPVARAGVGDIDPTFGVAGRFVHSSEYGGLTMLPNGSLQLVGTVTADSLKVLRLDRNGRPDPGFGVAGELLSGIQVDPRAVMTLAVSGHHPAVVRPDGVTYVALSAYLGFTASRNEARLVRLTAAGLPDMQFGQAGVRRFPPGDTPGADISDIEDMAVAAGGGLFIVVGYYKDSSDCTLARRIYRLTPSGAIDPAFGRDGAYLVAVPACPNPRSATVLALAAGQVFIGPPTGVLLDASGQPTAMPASWRDWLQTHTVLALAASGQFIYTVATPVQSPQYAIISRWGADLSPDPGFGTVQDAGTRIDVASLPYTASAFSQGDLLPPGDAGGYLYAELATSVPGAEAPGHVLLLRLDGSGNLDRALGTNGLLPDSQVRNFRPLAGVQQADGSRIVDTYDGELMRLAGTPASSAGFITLDTFREYYTTCDSGDLISVNRTSGELPVHVSRSLGTQGAVSVHYRTRQAPITSQTGFDPPAVPGVNFTLIEGTLSWADGETGQKEFRVPILNASVERAGQAFEVLLENVQGGAVLSCASMYVWIDAGASGQSVSQPPSSVSPSVGVVSPSAGVPAAGGGGAFDVILLSLLGSMLARRRLFSM